MHIMDGRGRRFKTFALTLAGLILAYSILSWYYSDRHLDVQNFELPGGFKLGSWSTVLPSHPSPPEETPEHEHEHGQHQQQEASSATNPISTPEPTLIPNTTDAGHASTPLSLNADENVAGVREELIKPSVDEPTLEHPNLAKITIMFGNDNPTYERALRTHEVHNRLHGYPVYVLRQQILNDVWTKPAYILSVLLKELTKPPEERLKWLLSVKKAAV